MLSCINLHIAAIAYLWKSCVHVCKYFSTNSSTTYKFKMSCSLFFASKTLTITYASTNTLKFPHWKWIRACQFLLHLSDSFYLTYFIFTPPTHFWVYQRSWSRASKKNMYNVHGILTRAHSFQWVPCSSGWILVQYML